MDLPENGFVVYLMLFASQSGQLSCIDSLDMDILC